MAAFFIPAFQRRWPLRKLLACAFILPGLAACTSASPLAVAKSPDQAASAASYGTIVSMRDLQPSALPTAGSRPDVRTAILDAIGGGASLLPVSTGLHNDVVEFIVHEDDGEQTVSVMQTNDARLRTGDRVLLTRGVRTHISRAGV